MEAFNISFIDVYGESRILRCPNDERRVTPAFLRRSRFPAYTESPPAGEHRSDAYRQVGPWGHPRPYPWAGPGVRLSCYQEGYAISKRRTAVNFMTSVLNSTGLLRHTEGDLADREELCPVSDETLRSKARGLVVAAPQLPGLGLQESSVTRRRPARLLKRVG
jgi:hypothetical protein